MRLLLFTAGLLWSQASVRPPTPALTVAQLEATPLTPAEKGKSVKRKLFDGRTLKGWQGHPGYWSVRDGVIVGKFNKVPTNFLFTDDTYTDFRLTFMSRMVESENHAGVSFWGPKVARPDNPWYVRGPLVVFPRPSMWSYLDAAGMSVYRPTTEKVTSQFEWIQVEILAQGNRVRTALNGVEVMEWREKDPTRVIAGPIGLQLHAWPTAQEVHYKNVFIETVPRQDRLITLKKPFSR